MPLVSRPVRRPRSVRGSLVLGVVALLLAATGCSTTASVTPGVSTSASSRPEASEPAARMRYVALGDSYTAAPLFPVKDVVNGCLRSSGNYPNKVAEARDLAMVDVSCSGASTVSMFNKQQFINKARPPQLEALTPDTGLVTLGIGANDFQFFSEMIFECIDLAVTDRQGAPCQERNQTAQGRDRLERRLGEISERLERVVDTIQERSPDAQIIMVGYPVLLPEEFGCPAKLPIARGDYPYTRRLNIQLSEAVRDGAVAAGADYIDMVEASLGHDICSDDPWVSGIRGKKGASAGLHPYPEEQEAVADLILELL